MNRLQEYRDRVKPRLSRNRLGHLAGIDGNTIYRIENGATTSVATARALAAALSQALGEPVTIDDLFGSQPEEASASTA